MTTYDPTRPRHRRLAGGFLALAMAGGLLAGPALPAAEAEQAPRMTQIRIKVRDCEGCVLSAFSFPAKRNVGEGTVRDGVVVLRIPTARTRGLGWIVENSAPDADDSAIVVLAAARYDGFKKGAKVSPTAAASAKRGVQCWAGTKKAKVTLKLKVQHFSRPNPDGDGQVDAIRPYFSPALASIGRPWRTYEGQLTADDLIDCSGNWV